ncbi:MAG: peptide ABC transporter substrate-binding protein [Pyrinomonadaceae bacterium]
MLRLNPVPLRLGVTLLGISLVAAGCSTLASNQRYFGKVKAPEGQVLRYISGAEPQTLDPQTMTGQPESRVAVALFDGLVEYEEVTMKPRKSLAESYEPNDDATVWTFHMRKDAKWTDGLPVTAHDMVYSWRRAVTPAVAASYASLMYVIKNAQPFNENGAFVRDPATGKFATTEDLKRAANNGPINFTGNEPIKYFDPALDQGKTAPPSALLPAAPPKPSVSTPGTPGKVEVAASTPAVMKEKLFTVPNDEKARNALVKGDAEKQKPGNAELDRFIAGKEFVEVTRENVGLLAIDDYTFQVTLEGPTAYFEKMLYHQFFRPVPRQGIEKYGETLWIKPENIITSGAFKLTEWLPYEKIVVSRNTGFWDNANTKLDQIIFLPTEQLTTGMNLYKSGEVDCTQSNEVPPPWREQLKRTVKDYKDGPYLQMEAIAIITTRPALKDIRVRKALSMALNRQIIADQAPGRLPSSSFVPPMDGYENAKSTGYDPVEARRLLAEAGFPNGQGFPPLDYLYNTAESNKQNAEFYQQMWEKELNIKVNLVNVEWRVYLDKTRAEKLDFNGLARWAWIGDYVDPNTFLELVTSGSANNRTDWHDKKFDGMLEAANAETVPATRSKLLHDAEQYMMDAQPMLPVYVGPSAFMCKPFVKNLVPNLLDQHDWRGVYIDHSAATE